MIRKMILCTSIAIVNVIAQNSMPVPSGYRAIADDVIREEQEKNPALRFKEIPHEGEVLLLSAQNIGDFDGDGSDEIFSKWQFKLEKDTLIPEPLIPVSMFAVYSMKKQTYLVADRGKGAVATGDFNGDGAIEFLIGNKIYESNTPVSKKKAH